MLPTLKWYPAIRNSPVSYKDSISQYPRRKINTETGTDVVDRNMWYYKLKATGNMDIEENYGQVGSC